MCRPGPRGDVPARSVVAVAPGVAAGALPRAAAELVHDGAQAARRVVAVAGAPSAGVEEVHEPLADVRPEIDDLEVALVDLGLRDIQRVAARVGLEAHVATTAVDAAELHAIAVATLTGRGAGRAAQREVHVVIAGEQLDRVRRVSPDRVPGPVAADHPDRLGRPEVDRDQQALIGHAGVLLPAHVVDRLGRPAVAVGELGVVRVGQTRGRLVALGVRAADGDVYAAGVSAMKAVKPLHR